MNVTYLSNDVEPDFFQLLTEGSIHYVSIAMPGFTNASVLVDKVISEFGSLGPSDAVEKRYALMSPINQAGETGTLFPHGNITLLPSPTETDRFGMSKTRFVDGQYQESHVIDHLKDAFVANSKYIKSAIMYFDFRYLCVSAEFYNSCLEASVESVLDDNLAHVYGWVPDPKWERHFLKPES